ncbi:hypothetical protein GOP97_11155 [Vibrio cholerae]|nr:hypothetical protein [Vibrio cholerae]HBC3475266.1 HNH endonuclease [Vibrio cholerae]
MRLKMMGVYHVKYAVLTFRECYGSHGDSYIEAHHIIPLSELCSVDGSKTRLEDLAMVCSNCHRMLHRAPRIDLCTLREQLK